MSIKVIAKQTMQTIGNYAGTYRYVLQAQLYNKLAEAKVIKEVNALYQCCTDPSCSKHASAWKSGGEYKTKIIERYNRISNL